MRSTAPRSRCRPSRRAARPRGRPPAGTALPINLDEVGEQTVVTGHEAAYTDCARERRSRSREQQQSASHVQLAEIAACDPDVKALLYFPLIDDTEPVGRLPVGEPVRRSHAQASYAGVKAKIAASKGLCQGGVAGIAQAWRHTTSVLGAQGIFGGPGARPARGRRPSRRHVPGLWTSFTVSEDASYTARLVRVPGGPVGAAADRGREGVLPARPAVREPEAGEPARTSSRSSSPR